LPLVNRSGSEELNGMSAFLFKSSIVQKLVNVNYNTTIMAIIKPFHEKKGPHLSSTHLQT